MTNPARTTRVATDDDRSPPVDHETGCITCGDTARRMRVLEVDQPRELAICVDAGERRHSIDIGIVDAPGPGDTLLVHAGAALAREPA
jgi:hypothetical protein